ncbi:MAG: YicC family protein [Bacteroidales bacterium]|nr:YicC family protein [Bacteroidales bacterium]
MITSMTGFGKSICRFGDKTIKTEIRSLNSKNLDLNIKTPNIYRERESILRNMLSSAMERGKVELIISLEQEGGQTTCAINKPMLMKYYQELKDVAARLDTQISDDFLPDLLRLPDVLRSQQEEVSAEEWEVIELSVKEAIDQANEYRRSEGEHLYHDLLKREKIIRTLLEEIKPLEKERINSVKERIYRSLKEMGENVKVDENRFEQEIIFYLEKLDITEEKVRLRKHLDYFHETLQATDAGGKKLGFISQEIGREINTIGSKANDAEIQKIVVQMKDELEKIKEQLMNVL